MAELGVANNGVHHQCTGGLILKLFSVSGKQKLILDLETSDGHGIPFKNSELEVDLVCGDLARAMIVLLQTPSYTIRGGLRLVRHQSGERGLSCLKDCHG